MKKKETKGKLLERRNKEKLFRHKLRFYKPIFSCFSINCLDNSQGHWRPPLKAIADESTVNDKIIHKT